MLIACITTPHHSHAITPNAIEDRTHLSVKITTEITFARSIKRTWGTRIGDVRSVSNATIPNHKTGNLKAGFVAAVGNACAVERAQSRRLRSQTHSWKAE